MENKTDVPADDPDDNGREITRMIQVVIRPLLIIFGTTGNILSFLLMRRGSLKTVSTCFYMSILALADTGVLWCGAFPGWIIFVTHFKVDLFALSHCKLLNFGYRFTRHYSSAILVIMCVEKFFALYFPLLAKRLCTVKTAKVVTLVTTCVYIAYDFQCFFVLKKDLGSFGCQVVSQSYEAVFYRLDSVLYSFGPFTIMVITNAAIIYKLMSVKIKESKGGSNPTGQAISKSATKGIAMLLIVSVMFVVLTGPMAVASILNNLNEPWVEVPSYIMQYMNHCINGVLYCIVGSKFRRELFKILPCCKRNRVENQPLTETAKGPFTPSVCDTVARSLPN